MKVVTELAHSVKGETTNADDSRCDVVPNGFRGLGLAEDTLV